MNFEPGDMLRVAVAGGLIGFATFCSSYAMVVWFRRNKSNRTGLALPRAASLLLILVGGGGGLLLWSLDALEQRTGIVDGDEIFVVRAKRDATVKKLSSSETVEAGAVIAEFRTPQFEGQLAVIDNQIQEGRARLQAMEARIPTIDSVLVQRQAQLRMEIDQQRQLELNLKQQKREFTRDKFGLFTSWTKEKGQIETDLATSRKAINITDQQIRLAREAVSRSDTLLAKQIVTIQVSEQRKYDLLTYTLDRTKHEVTADELEKRLAILEATYGSAAALFESEIAKITGDITATGEKIRELEEVFGAVNREVTADQERARIMMAREMEAEHHRVGALGAERRKALSMTEIRAPYSGRIVYRNPAPSLASDNAPVLALSTGSGFNARVWMPRDEVKKVARAGPVKLAFEHAVLTRYLGGTFTKMEAAPFEDSRVIAHFAVNMPNEVISLLRTDDPVRVRLLWRPDPLTTPGVQGCLAAAFAGVLGLLFSTRRRHSSRFKLALVKSAE